MIGSLNLNKRIKNIKIFIFGKRDLVQTKKIILTTGVQFSEALVGHIMNPCPNFISTCFPKSNLTLTGKIQSCKKNFSIL